MPGIWNINNGYNTNSKKLSSKLTFEVGEKFTGRVVSKGEGKEVTIKLSDGWQFTAEVEEDVDFEELKLVKFEVEGSENGKLQLKIIKDEIKENNYVDENFQEIIEKEGLSKEDINILKKMITYNIPLTRKNISDIKTLLQFNQKLNIDKDEVNSFINKYIASKNIEINSEQGQAIKEVLTKFFDEFKNMSTDDIMIFVENNIEFNEENIDSYNKLFKGDSSIESVLDNIKNDLSDANLEKIFERKNENIDVESLKQNNLDSDLKGEKQNSSLASKVYSENIPINNKVDVLNILKTISSNNEENVNIQDSVLNRVLSSENKYIEELLNDKDILNKVKDLIKDTISIEDNKMTFQASKLVEAKDKANIEELFSKIQNKDVSLSKDEFKKIVDYVRENKSESENIVLKSETQSNLNDDFFKTVINNDSNEKNITIKAQIKNEIEKTSNIVKSLVDQTDLNEEVKDKIFNIVKSNLNDFKVFNSLSNEYYYMNFNINAQNTEYPCKLIIKDSRKDGKKIDSTNVKMVVSVKTVNLGEIDSYLTLRDKRIDVNLQCSDEVELTIKKHRNELSEGLKTLGLIPNITISSKDSDVTLPSCRKFFNDVTISTIDTRV